MDPNDKGSTMSATLGSSVSYTSEDIDARLIYLDHAHKITSSDQDDAA